MARSVFRSSIFFFFSSRRRHTRFDCDWSSDVALPISRAPGNVRIVAQPSCRHVKPGSLKDSLELGGCPFGPTSPNIGCRANISDLAFPSIRQAGQINQALADGSGFPVDRTDAPVVKQNVVLVILAMDDYRYGMQQRRQEVLGTQIEVAKPGRFPVIWTGEIDRATNPSEVVLLVISLQEAEALVTQEALTAHMKLGNPSGSLSHRHWVIQLSDPQAAV